MTKKAFGDYLANTMEDIARKYVAFGKEHPECLHDGEYYMDLVLMSKPNEDKMYCRVSTKDGCYTFDSVELLMYVDKYEPDQK
jgi:hypothetical protein